MLRFTKQLDHGLMAMQYIAAHKGDAPVGVKRIADEVGQVIRLLEGPLAIVSCMANHRDCAQVSRCTVRNPARKLQAAITDLLDTTTLAELTGDDVPAVLAAQR